MAWNFSLQASRIEKVRHKIMTERGYEARNLGFWSRQEQECLESSKVAVIGVGGDGFQLGAKLAMMGVGEIRAADPEVFEIENSNRVIGSRSNALGQNKAEAFREFIDEMPQNTTVRVFEDGATAENIDEIVDGVDLVVDESELRYLHVATMIARKAIECEVPVLSAMNIGFAGVATSYKPNYGSHGFHKAMGIDPQMPLDEVRDQPVQYSNVIPYLPSYGDYNVLRVVHDGVPLPSISPGVDIASGIGTAEAFLHLVQKVDNRRKKPVWAPRYRYYDAYTQKAGVVRHPKMSYYAGALAMATRTKLGMNPTTNYSAHNSAN